MPFEPLETEQPIKPRFEPLQEKPLYNYVPPDGDSEDILIEQTGETVKAPAGTGAVLQYAQNDDTFAPAPSTFMEETAAQFEKQAALITFVAWGTGAISDEQAAEMVAERSRALAYAQSRYPEYMKKFNEDYEAQEGLFGKAWVIATNPSAIIRSNVTQSPTGLIPLVGFGAGAGVGSLFSPVGTAVGGFTGSVAGGTAVNVGARMDEILAKKGVDVTNPEQLLKAFQNPETRRTLIETASASGLSQSVVEALFDTVAGRYLKMHQTSSLAKRAAAGAGEVAVQAGGEMAGEAAAQAVAYGDVDLGDVLLEGVTTLPQSLATVAVGAATQERKVTVDDVEATKEIVDIEVERRAAEAEQQRIVQSGGDDTEIRQKIVDLNARREDAVNRLADMAVRREEKVAGMADREKAAVESKDEEVRQGRIKKLTDDIKPIERQLDMLEAKFFEDIAEGNDTSTTESKIQSLLDKKGQIEYEMEVMRDEGLSKPENLAKKDITVKGGSLINAEKKAARQRATAVVKAFKEGIETAKTDIKSAQTMILDIVRESGLGKEAVGIFEKEILESNTPQKAATRLPKVQKKVVELLDKRLREETVTKIQKAVRRASKSRVIDVGFAKRIQEAVRDVDFTKRTEATKKKLQSALDYYSQNTDVKPPKKLLKKLELLGKKQSGEMTTTELLGVLEEVTSLVRKGKKKQTIKNMQAKNRMESRLKELQNSKKIQKFHVGRADLGERMAVTQRMKNAFAEIANKEEAVRISKNSMDVFFDMLDGAVKYTGPAHRIFKKTIDRSYSNYLNLRDKTSKEVFDITRETSYTQEELTRIGAHAALLQDGGREKLLSMGYTEKELDGIKLTEKEQKLYDAMRRAFESLYPKVSETMADVYNQSVKKVDNYFPFLTDFDQDAGKNIEDIINRLVEPDVKKTKRQKNVNKGFTIERTGGDQKIKIDAMKIFTQHVDNATYLAEMARDIKELSELAGKPGFQEVVGDMGQEFILDWLDLLAKKGRNPDSIGSLDALRRNTGLAFLAYRISSIAIQTTALLEGATLIGGNYVSRGVNAIALSREWRKFVYDNMPEVRDRLGDDPFWETLGGAGVWKKTQEAGMYGIKKLDHMVASAVASGAYMRAVEANGGKVDLSKPNADALLEAQLYMRRTQSSAFAKDTPLLLSQGKLSKSISKKYGSSSWDKLIFQLQSFLLNRWSIISHDLFRTSGIKPTQQSLSIVTFLVLANMAEYGIRQGSREAIEGLWSAMDMGGEPPEEKELSEEVVTQALSNIPFVSSFVRSLEYGQPPVPAAALLDRANDEWAYAVRSKDPEKKWRHYGNAVAIAGGAFFGIPGASQIPALTKALSDGDGGEGWGDGPDWGKRMEWGEKPNWK